jgi:hypothetical protein
MRNPLWATAMRLLLPLVFAGCGGSGSSQAQPAVLSAESVQHLTSTATAAAIPGLVLGLRHNVNQQRDGVAFSAMLSAPVGAPALRFHGGDLGSWTHAGYDWWMIQDDPAAPASRWALPPGIVFALRHSLNQPPGIIAVRGVDSVTGPTRHFALPLARQHGGDLGPGGSAGDGYYWYESTGDGFSDWNKIDELLPRYTVLGLKHAANQVGKTFTWQGQLYDPANPSIPPPPGFERRAGGDFRQVPFEGRDSGYDPAMRRQDGYYWYEKVTGPEIVMAPLLRVQLSRSLFESPTDDPSSDRDRDGLIDDLENVLADAVRPYLIFDSNEAARVGERHEPVTLFTVSPYRGTGPANATKEPTSIRITWLFLFQNDGGYGPASWCRKDHKGDNDNAYYELESQDGTTGKVWRIRRVVLAPLTLPPGRESEAFRWPDTSRMDVYQVIHPVIYMSSHKHHEYFTRDWDESDSYYGERWVAQTCNDNVDGQGFRCLADIQMVAKSEPETADTVACLSDRRLKMTTKPGSAAYNNAGEAAADAHSTPPFVNDLSRFFPGQSAWSTESFYDSGTANRAALCVIWDWSTSRKIDLC